MSISEHVNTPTERDIGAGDANALGTTAAPFLSWLQQKSAVYNDNVEDFLFWRNSFLGGRYLNEIQDYLFRYPRESDSQTLDSDASGGKTSYQRRKERLHYVNFCKTLIGLFTDAVFKNTIPRRKPVGEDLWEAFEQNCDLDGSSLDQFFKDFATWLQVYGVMGLLVENPGEDVARNAMTKADLRDLRAYPYFVAVPPTKIVDFSADSMGQLNWIRIESQEQNDAEPGVLRRESVKSYLVYTRKDWTRYDERGVRLGGASHSMGVVPFRFAYNSRKVRVGEGQSALSDIGPLNRVLTNTMSMLDEIMYEQTFSIMTLPVIMGNDADMPRELQVGPLFAMTYPSEAPRGPDFIAPDVAQAAALRQQALDLIDLMYYCALQRFGNTAAKPAVRSGIAVAYETQTSDQGIAAFANELQDVENWAHIAWKARKDKKPIHAVEGEVAKAKKTDAFVENPPVTVSAYPDSFDLLALEALLGNIAQAESMALMPPQFKASAARTIANRVLPKMTQAEQKEFDEEMAVGLERAKEMFEAPPDPMGFEGEQGGGESQGSNPRAGRLNR